jgi:hypothetical protein
LPDETRVALLSSPSPKLRRTKSGRLDAIRTSFLTLPDPDELETQFDLLATLSLQNEVIRESDGKASDIQPNPVEILYHGKVLDDPVETIGR